MVKKTTKDEETVKLAIELSDEDVDLMYQEYVAREWLKLVYGGKDERHISNEPR